MHAVNACSKYTIQNNTVCTQLATQYTTSISFKYYAKYALLSIASCTMQLYAYIHTLRSTNVQFIVTCRVHHSTWPSEYIIVQVILATMSLLVHLHKIIIIMTRLVQAPHTYRTIMLVLLSVCFYVNI